MINASHVKAHAHAAGTIGGSALTKGGVTQKYNWPWMRRVCRCEPLLRRRPVSGYFKYQVLMEDLLAQCLLVGKGYDTNAIAEGD